VIGLAVVLVDTASAATDEVEMLPEIEVGPGGGGSLVGNGMFERVEAGGSVRDSELEG
jgi:hypothetical protein